MKKFRFKRFVATVVWACMLFSGTFSNFIPEVKANAAEKTTCIELPISIDGNSDDWELYKSMPGIPATFEYVKAVKTKGRLYVAFKTSGTPEAVTWF